MSRLVGRIENLLKGGGGIVVRNGEDVEKRFRWRIQRYCTVSCRRAVEDDGCWPPLGLNHNLDCPVDAEVPRVCRRVTRDASNVGA